MKKFGMPQLLISAAVAFAVLWVVVVWRTGLGENWWDVGWDFEVTGQLGDSFGVVSAVMTSLAAYFAFRTYSAAREEMKLQEQDGARRMFLDLLERRVHVVDQVRIGTKVGHDALEQIARRVTYSQVEDAADAYERVVFGDVPARGLGALFRYTYRLVKMADEDHAKQQPVTKNSDAYKLVRLLRSQMTDAELLTLGCNCLTRRGAAFKPLVEKYAMLHNLSPGDAEDWGFTKAFERTAFGLTEEDQAEVLGWRRLQLLPEQ